LPLDNCPKNRGKHFGARKSIPRSDKWERAMKAAYAALSRLEENPPENISEFAHAGGQLRRLLFSQLGQHAD
jgi:hypothetical protein